MVMPGSVTRGNREKGRGNPEVGVHQGERAKEGDTKQFKDRAKKKGPFV